MNKTEEQLRKDADFFQKYVGVDKIYLETYREEFATKEEAMSREWHLKKLSHARKKELIQAGPLS